MTPASQQVCIEGFRRGIHWRGMAPRRAKRGQPTTHQPTRLTPASSSGSAKPGSSSLLPGPGPEKQLPARCPAPLDYYNSPGPKKLQVHAGQTGSAAGKTGPETVTAETCFSTLLLDRPLTFRFSISLDLSTGAPEVFITTLFALNSLSPRL